MKKIFLLSVLSLLRVCLFAQPANLNFENWYTDTAGKLRLYNWQHLVGNSNYPNLAFFGTWCDSVPESGVYALRLSRWYSYTDDWAKQIAPVSTHPSAIEGYYKYVDNTLIAGTAAYDTGLVSVYLTAWNPAMVKEDTIGIGSAFLTLNNVYTKFSGNIIYSGNAKPDSITINIFPSKGLGGVGVCQNSGMCSYLTIDNLSLAAQTDVTAPHLANGVQIFPNPVSTFFYLDTKDVRQVRIINSTGIVKGIYNILPGNNKICVESLPAGLYIIVAGTDEYKMIKL